MMRFLVVVICFFYVPFVLSKHTRIVGGIKVEDSPKESPKFPFAVAIYTHTYSGFNYSFCGGTLLEGKWVVTAAACIHEVLTVRIVLGSYRLSGVDVNRRSILCSDWYTHPDFNPEIGLNDIGLIRIPPGNWDIDSNARIQSVPLTINPVHDYLPVTLVGWGTTSNSMFGGLSDDLRFANMSVLTFKECYQVYGDRIIEDRIGCARGKYFEEACNGDIGGGLIYYVNNHHPTLTGLASFLHPEGCQKGPSGFTKIFPYKGWIENMIGPFRNQHKNAA